MVLTWANMSVSTVSVMGPGGEEDKMRAKDIIRIKFCFYFLLCVAAVVRYFPGNGSRVI